MQTKPIELRTPREEAAGELPPAHVSDYCRTGITYATQMDTGKDRKSISPGRSEPMFKAWISINHLS